MSTCQEVKWSRVVLALLVSDLVTMFVIAIGLMRPVDPAAMLLSFMLLSMVIILPVTFLICLPLYALFRALDWLNPALILIGGMLAALLFPAFGIQANPEAVLSVRLALVLAYFALAGLIAALVFCRLTGLHIRERKMRCSWPARSAASMSDRARPR